jgi:hypothetical protein
VDKTLEERVADLEDGFRRLILEEAKRLATPHLGERVTVLERSDASQNKALTVMAKVLKTLQSKSPKKEPARGL